MNSLMSKLASNRTANISHWGLPKEKLFPIDTPALVKKANDEFGNQVDNMTIPQRLVCARSICARAEELGVEVESGLAYKYAGANLSRHFESFIGLRKHATAHVADDELDKLIEVANILSVKDNQEERVKGLDKVASALEDFDIRHRVAGIPDAAYSTYGLTATVGEEVRLVVKVAGFEVQSSDLNDADWSKLDGKLSPEIIDGMKGANDKLAVFSSLPEPEKELMYQTLFMG